MAKFVDRLASRFGFVRKAAPAAATRTYSNAVPRLATGRMTGFASSADAELMTGLSPLRTRSRMLVRDAAYAKNAKRVIVNNVIGNGIRLQGQVKTSRDQLNDRVNSGIEREFKRWSGASSAHTGGELHFHDLERAAMGQVFEAGEVFIRMHRSRFGDSKVPICLELIEGERIAESVPPAMNVTGVLRLGVEVDKFSRPIAYYVRDLHPGDIRANFDSTSFVTRVPAEDMIHLKVTDRWPQTRGEPWMHAVAEKLQDMSGYSEAEIIAARGAASYLGILETPDSNASFADEQPDGSFNMSVEAGTWMRTLPGEKATFVSPNRPNGAVDPFLRFMLREIAAGAGVSYESLSRDYSQSNYSSSRLALLDDRDNWRALQIWFIRAFRERLHRQWLQAAVLAGAISEIDTTAYALAPDKFECVKFRPRGWTWVDPTKEVEAFKSAVKAGFTTVEKVIANTSDGDDLEDLMNARELELAFMDEKNLAFDTSPSVYVPAETRGLMIVGESGGVEPAASLAPASAPGSQASAQEDEADPAQSSTENTDSTDGGSAKKPGRITEFPNIHRSSRNG